jgi:FkbM family methyltransferase
VERNLSRFAALARALLGDRILWIVEVGARDCRETLGFAEQFPDARIFAFECNPDTLPACRAAVAGRPKIRLIEKAATERPGRMDFYAVDPAVNPGASSLYPATGQYQLENYPQKRVEIEAVTLESFLAAEAIPGIDLLWMDIQGAELAALRGLGPRLDDVALIHAEVEFEEIYRGQPLFPEVRAFLESRGFRFLGFTIYARHSADAVFANRRKIGAFAALRALAASPLLLRKRLQYLRHRLKRRLGFQRASKGARRA